MSGYPDANDFAPAAGQGGFLASPGADQSPSQKTFRAADQQTLTPVTIKMLWSAEQGSDEVFRVDGQPLVQVNCARVRASLHWGRPWDFRGESTQLR